MFEQHPVPQQISSYQFRLVGDMTLKQFFQLAGGALISLLIYGSPLPGIFKWPFIVLFALGGAALAFLPIEDRPLDKWVVAFFRSIYSPTIYTWKRTDTAINYFSATTTTPTLPEAPATDEQQQQQQQSPAPALPVVDTKVSVTPPPPIQGTDVVAVSEPAIKPTAPVPQARVITEILETPAQTPPSTPIVQAPIKPTIVVPTLSTPQIARQGFVPAQEAPPVQTGVSTTVEQVFSAQTPGVATQAQYSQTAAPPAVPTQANLIVGQAIDEAGEIIDGVILEIKDSAGRPVRALRSNKVGHFQTVTAIANGDYQLTAEKDGFDFSPISVHAAGGIIEPIIVKGTKHAA